MEEDRDNGLGAESGAMSVSSSLALSGSDEEEDAVELSSLEPMLEVPPTQGETTDTLPSLLFSKIKLKAGHRKTESSASLGDWLGSPCKEEGEPEAEDLDRDVARAPTEDAPAEVSRERSDSLAASPGGEVDEECARLCDLIKGLKETLAREECVGLQRHQGDYLLQKGEDLLAQRRAQAASAHVTNASGELAAARTPPTPGPERVGDLSPEDFLSRAQRCAEALLSSASGGEGGEAPAAPAVVHDSDLVSDLVSIVESFLARGLRAQPLHPLEGKDNAGAAETATMKTSPRKTGTWIKGLRWMVAKPQPYNALYAAEAQHSVDLGLRVIIAPRQTRQSIRGGAKVRAWARNCLVEGTLSRKLDQLRREERFLKIWYEDSSMIRSPELSSRLVQSLEPLSRARFDILLWPAQEIGASRGDAQGDPPGASAIFSSGRLTRERAREVDSFAKDVRDFHNKEKLVTVIGEHSPGLRDIDEILSSPGRSSAKKGRRRGGRGKKRVVDAAEIGRERLERKEETKSAGGDDFSFASFSFADLAPPSPSPPPSRVGFDVAAKRQDEGPGSPIRSRDPAPSTLSDSIAAASTPDEAGGLWLDVEENQGLPSLDPEEADLATTSPELVAPGGALERAEEEASALLDQAETAAAAAEAASEPNFLLETYEPVGAIPGVEEAAEEEAAEELVSQARDILALEGTPARPRWEDALSASPDFLLDTYEASAAEQAERLIEEVRAEVEAEGKGEGEGGVEDDEGAFGCTAFGSEYLLDEVEAEEEAPAPPLEGQQEDPLRDLLDLPSVPAGPPAPRPRAEAQEPSRHEEEEVEVEEEDSADASPSASGGNADSGSSGELVKTFSELTTLSDLTSVLTDSGEAPATARVEVVSGVGILDVGILGVETHGDRWQSYTVYQVYVQSAGGLGWLLRRRYRDFVKLQSDLNRCFPRLPRPWEEVRLDKFLNFGHLRFSATVIEERRELLQECLRVACASPPPLCTAEPLLRFLSPEGGEHGILQQIGFNGSNQARMPMELGARECETSGQSVRLLVEEPQSRSAHEQLQVQHGRCAGCSVRIRGNTWTLPFGVIGAPLPFGSNKGFALCEYTKQLYCTDCHQNQRSILPWCVLQNWDFCPGRVSDVAHEYLTSIADQPILCVSAIRPQLFSRIPLFQKLRDQRISLHKRFLRLHGTRHEHELVQALGHRAYYLENTEFWSMSDLVSVSKGAYSELPGVLEQCEKDLQQHTWEALRESNFKTG